MTTVAALLFILENLEMAQNFDVRKAGEVAKHQGGNAK